MALPAVVAGIAAGIQAAPGVVAGIESVLDKLVGRSIIFEVKNMTGEPLRIEMEGNGHSSGGFSAPPPHQINPFEAAAFASRSVGDLRGSMRLVGNGVWFGMSFSNAVIGSNELRSSVNGGRAAEFAVHAVAGNGNSKARFAYVAFYSDPQRVVQAHQAHTQQKSGSSRPSPIPALGKAKPKKKQVDPGQLIANPEELVRQRPMFRNPPKK
ncbi:MAG: hypothetical protein EA350_08340 [Gemmatimonadales bacterium]|nr:MAG: hypothetical protein EA350_08340 [Gemmatimonadales bacterium]